jgi:asparagine synthetase B (glutamine-hydrolysing)
VNRRQQQEAPMDQAEVVAMQDRFLDDMEAILGETASAGGKLIVMLSGGSDSFLIIAVLRHLLPDAPLHTVTIGGDDTRDADGADAVAAHFRTAHTVRRVTVDEIVGHLDLVRGTGYQRPGKVFSHVCYHLALTSCDPAGATVYAGHAGDVLLGNKKEIYSDIEASAETQGVSPDELRTRLKAEYYDKSQAAFLAGDGGQAGRHIASIVEGLGGKIVLPYRDPRLAYVSRIPYEVLRPADKRFVKDALRRRYGLGDLVERRRVSIQKGTGLYESFKARLQELDPSLSPPEIVARLSA